jgi:hypothetical protein
MLDFYGTRRKVLLQQMIAYIGGPDKVQKELNLF